MTASVVVAGVLVVSALRVVAERRAVTTRLGASAATPVAAWTAFGARRTRPLPDVLDDLASSLRSGATVRVAVVEAADREGALGGLADALAAGRTLEDSLEEWVRHEREPGAALVGAALLMADDLGGRAAESLEGVAATLRGRASATDEARTQATQAQVSVVVLVVAPLLFGAAAALADPAVARFFASPPGAACAAIALLADAVGALWMRRMIGRVG